MPNANDLQRQPALAPSSPSAPSARPSAASRAPRSPWSRVLASAATGIGLAAAAWVLASARVPCGFARVFHVPCPGCGSTRAMLALAHGDLAGLLRHNPLAPMMTLFVVLLSVQALGSVLATGTFARVGDGRVGLVVSRGVLLVGALQVVIWVARFAGLFGGPVPV